MRISSRPYSPLSPWISLLALLPCVSAVAAYMGFHTVLVAIFFVLGLSVFVTILKSKGSVDDRLLMLLVWSISLSLILASTFTSDYLRGSDVHREYFAALQTSMTGVWSTRALDPYTSVLSVAVLPTMITGLSALEMVQVFKFVYPVIFSLVPVILYKVTRRILAPGAAFLSVFLFMSYDTFYDLMLGLGRQEIAEFLLALLILVVLSPGISKGISGKLTVVLLMIGFAASHYALVYIFIFILAYSCLTSRAFRRTNGLMLLGLMLVTGIAWYTFAAGGAGILDLVRNGSSVLGGLTSGMFSSGSRPEEVMKAVGVAQISSGPLQQMNRWTQITVQGFILLGFVVLVLSKPKSTSEQEMLPLMTGGLILLGSSVVLPGLAETLNLTRIYHIALLFIAPLFVYGAQRFELTLRDVGSRLQHHRRLGSQANQRKALHLAAAILFFYFLFVSAWFTVVTAGSPTSYILDSSRMRHSQNPAVSGLYYEDFTVLSDISGAKWLLYNGMNSLPVCSDIIAKLKVLTSYGEYPSMTGQYFTDFLPANCQWSTSYVYLNEFNNFYGVGFTIPMPDTFPISDMSQTVLQLNMIYSNGGTTIYA